MFNGGFFWGVEQKSETGDRMRTARTIKIYYIEPQFDDRRVLLGYKLGIQITLGQLQKALLHYETELE